MSTPILDVSNIHKRFGSLEALSAAEPAELEEVEGIGPVIAAAVATWLAEPRHEALVSRLAERGIDPREEVSGGAPASALEGQTFVITGTLPRRSREECKAAIQDAGGKVTGSVSKRTDFLVAGEKAGSKLAKAEKLNVPVLDEDALDAMLGA